MNKFIEIIKQTQKFIFCPICNRKFSLDEIRLRGFLDDVLFLQTSCDNSHPFTSISIVTAITDGSLDQKLESEKKEAKDNGTVLNTKSESLKNLTESDIIDLGMALGSFDGNFELLWNK